MTEFNTPKMDDEYISKHDIVQRYLQNKLTPEETVEFEEYFLDKPEILEQLELDMVLVEALPHANPIRIKQTDVQKQPAPPSLWSTLFGTPAKASIATAFACALLAVVMIPKPAQVADPLAGNLEIFYLSDVRSGDPSAQSFELNPQAEAIIFVLEGEFEAETPYKVTMNNIDTQKTIPLAAAYLPSEVSEIYVSISSNLLNKGSYQFSYHPVGNPSIAITSTMTIQ